MAATQNTVLEAIGSSLRLADDGTYEDSAYALSFNNWGGGYLAEGMTENDVFSYYGGCSVYVTVDPIPSGLDLVLFANANTERRDGDGDGLGIDVPQNDGSLIAMATEQRVGCGEVIVAGTAFMNDYDLLEGSANYTVTEKLLKKLNPPKVTPIWQVRDAEEGMRFTITGIVSSNASGYDKDTAFFDCIYVQDATAGINAFPVAGNFKIGDSVRITGTTSSYQGERQISVETIELVGSGKVHEPRSITAQELNDRSYEGSLVTLKGKVESFEYANGMVQTIMVRDAEGNLGRVFIDGYITTGYDVENLAVGATVIATGLASYDDSFDGPAPRIRIRDRKDVLCMAPMQFTDVPAGSFYYDAVEWAVTLGITNGASATEFNPNGELKRAQVVTMLWRAAGEPMPTITENPFTDVEESQWYYNAVLWAVEKGITKGVSETEFAPNDVTNRAEAVTFLWRWLDEPMAPTSDSFSDVVPGMWYENAINWAVKNQVTNGMEGGIFGIDVDCNRAHMVTFLYRAMVG